MRRVERLRRQHREYLIDKMLPEPGFRIGGKVAHGRYENIFVCELLRQGRPDPLLMFEQ